MAEIKIFTEYKMKRITNVKKRENRQTLLKEAGFKTIQDAKKSLGLMNDKAAVVYEVLMNNYNGQIDEIRKNQQKANNKITYDINKDVKRVKNFNKDGESITLKKMSPQKFKNIIRNIDSTKRTVINVDGRYYTITPETQKMLLGSNLFITEKTSGSYNHVLEIEANNIEEITISRPKWKGKNNNEGAFFKFYHTTSFDLDEFGIHREKQEVYNENCFVQALISLGVDDNIITDVRKIICSKYIPTNKLTQIAEKFGLYIRVKTIDAHKDTKNFGKKGGIEILLGLIDQHYFAVKKVNMTKYAVTNYFDICDKENFHTLYPNGAILLKDKLGKRFTNSWDTIKYMYEHQDTYLTPIPYEDLLNTQYFNEAKDIVKLEYTKDNVKENVVNKKAESTDSKIVFFDFETITNELIHKPYMVCNSETEIEYDENCGHKMLKKLYLQLHDEFKTIILVAHNAGYDFRFIQQYLNIDSIIERGHNVMEVKGKFYYTKGKSIDVILKDSYSIITMPLKKFGKCFGLSQAKEILPYNLYTTENISKRFLSTAECKNACDIQVRCDNLDRFVNDEDYNEYFQQFVGNASQWGCIKDGLIDILEYSKIYCEKDVEVLKQGYGKFGEMLSESCDMKIENFISSAQLAHQYMLEKDVFNDVLKLSSTPRDYIMKCMVGGRTMCAENKKSHLISVLDDFDAVSLYPSAMQRLGGYLKGSPKVLENKSYGFLQKQDGYFVQIKVLKVGKKYKFPQMSYINDEGVRVFTNEPPNNLFVCKFDLEDLIKFHQIEFEVVDGYYYDEGRNMELKSVIENVFQERLKLKELENPLQEIYKLIMNSSYGKTLQKAIPDEIKFKSGEEIDNFIDKHYNRIVHYEEYLSPDCARVV